MSWLDDVEYGPDGLVPVIAQEAATKDVLMHAWMNREALERTVERGVATYWSRSRRRLWTKGEESGNMQAVREVRLDCDRDTILLVVEQTAAVPGEPAIACHTGRHACFFERLEAGAWRVVEPVLKDPAAIYPVDR